jgi:hypothetical protein
MPWAIEANFDYDNVFVGQYGLGDVAYRRHSAMDSLNLLYYKETKNFADGCSAHVTQSHFRGGNLALPGGHGTFVIEHTHFAGDIHLESSHHCGHLCMPTYWLVNTTWASDVSVRVQWGANHGAMFTLGPDECAAGGGQLFPPGYCAATSQYWTYLAALARPAQDGGGPLCRTAAEVAAELGKPDWAARFESDALVCHTGLRRLTIWTVGLTHATAAPLALEVREDGILVANQTVHYFQQGEEGSVNRRQGYAMPVVPGRGREYTLRVLAGNGAIPDDWIIEFGDLVFGNRGGAPDELELRVIGRTCPPVVHSHHDRRWIWADSNEGNWLVRPGRGACTAHPDMTLVDCSAVSAPPMLPAPADLCPFGRAGPYCARDLCAEAACGSGSACSFGYLGGDLVPEAGACLCAAGLFGPRCTVDPCIGVDCGTHGTCVALAATEHFCRCDNGWDGATCDHACEPDVDCVPPCELGFRYHDRTDFASGDLAQAFGSSVRECAAPCESTPGCTRFAHLGTTCYLKHSGAYARHAVVSAGIRCDEPVRSTQTPSPPPPPTPPPTPPLELLAAPCTAVGCHMAEHADLLGADLRQQPAGTPAVCCALCSDTLGCNAWTLAGGVCYMKTQANELLYRSGMWSGILCNTSTTVPTTRVATTTAETATTSPAPTTSTASASTSGSPLHPPQSTTQAEKQPPISSGSSNGAWEIPVAGGVAATVLVVLVATASVVLLRRRGRRKPMPSQPLCVVDNPIFVPGPQPLHGAENSPGGEAPGGGQD